EAVAAATTNSPLWLGEVSTTNLTLSPLAAGLYFWRVDALTQYGTVAGSIHSFVVSSISPSSQQVKGVTFPNRSITTTLSLTSQTSGEPWYLIPDSNWISLSQTNGTTPATIQITMDASVAAPLVRAGSLTVNGAGGRLFSIPVQLTVESLYLRIMKSDPES